MNTSDFNRLNGLLCKLQSAAEKAQREDGSFRKYHSQSVEAVRAMRNSLKNLEHGLKTANMIPTSAPEIEIIQTTLDGTQAA